MINITIDGPSGSGKSTIAKALAEDMGITYLDTGAMYRAIGYFVLSKNIDTSDEIAIIDILDDIDMDIKYLDKMQKVFINGKDITPFIRENKISMAASTVSKIPAVRIKLVELQRKLANINNCVIDGRDIGSYVLPNAKYKFYMTADARERAKRRYKELKEKGENVSFDNIYEEILKRDLQDSTRDFAPLVVPNGAIVIDTTIMSIAEVKDKIKEYL